MSKRIFSEKVAVRDMWTTTGAGFVGGLQLDSYGRQHAWGEELGCLDAPDFVPAGGAFSEGEPGDYATTPSVKIHREWLA